MKWLRWLRDRSIWAHDAIPEGEKKYRNLKRIYLPAYDAVVVYIGLMGALFGSNLLNSIFHAELVDILSWTFAAAGAVCFLGVAFPKLWAVEMFSKLILLGMIALGIPVVLFRLELLGNEYRQRKADQALDKALAEALPTRG